MLQIKNIKKEYKTGDLVQKALDGVSLNFRDNEFVAILGPSGSGKTTLLNIIGGLDQYDSGDLIINGISTKQYKDRDWDSYRNHTIGFVFQNYNLIPHQTVLENVELALTISGISKQERRQKAREALEKVGLGDQLHKRPSQMSGGQMQRVAIARALVNDSDILLADEPTGALDSDTSLQVMELLKEVASDRLVIMVTHNGELADEYATRIVNLKDGKVTADSDPFEPEIAEEEPRSGVNLGYSTMSFFTALQLSFRNLLTKKARTILVALAGSIGIIGIALILSTSNGVNKYIEDIEEDTLSEYPLEITGNSFSIFSMLEDLTGMGGTTDSAEVSDSAVVMKTVTALLSQMNSNDLKSLKEYVESGSSGIEPYARSIRYIYNVNPLIYQMNGDKIRKVSPYELLSTFDNGMFLIGSSASSYSTSATDFFHELPPDEELYKKQYDVQVGRWPENYNECVIVLNATNSVSDLTIFVLGLADDSFLEEAVNNYLKTGKIESDKEVDTPEYVKYEDFLDVSFRLVNASDCYNYDEQYKVWTSKMNDKEFMKKLVGSSEEMKVVGVVKAQEGSTGAMLHAGINYTPELTQHIIQVAEDSGIVKDQLKTPSVNVLTGRPFDETTNELPDLFSLFSLDKDALLKAFSMNINSIDSSQLSQILMNTLSSNFSLDSLNLQDYLPSEISIDQIPEIKNLFNEETLKKAITEITHQDFSALLDKIKIDISQEDLKKTVKELTKGFEKYGKTHPEADITSYQNAIRDFLATDEAREIIINGIQEMIRSSSDSIITQEDLQKIASDISEDYKKWAEEHGKTEIEKYPEYLEEYLQSEELLQLLQKDVTELFAKAAGNLDPEALNSIADKLYEAFQKYLDDNHLPTLESISNGFLQYLQSEEAETILRENIVNHIDTTELEAEVSNQITSYLMNNILDNATIQSITSSIVNTYMGSVGSSISQALSSQIQNAMSSIGAQLASSFGSMFDPEKIFSFEIDTLKDAVTLNMNADDLRALLTSILSNEQTTYEKNLADFGYADLNSPSEILIYPKDFDSKNALTDILQEYNQRMIDSGQEEKVISFSDMMSTMMSSVSTIINAISYVLIAFVAISLIVSSIMIGVITYISVFERRKEIGILRAIGASKGNIANVFNAETIITGLLSGLFGVGLTYLLLIPANIILRSLTGQDIMAFLPVSSAAILVLLSIILTLIGGLIPSSKAANSDPVTALRNE